MFGSVRWATDRGFEWGYLDLMAEEPKRRRLRQKRSSTRAKLRQQAKIRKIIWISVSIALGLAIAAIFVRYAMLAAD